MDNNILASNTGGGCVGVTFANNKMIAKAMPCEEKLFMSCQGQKVKLSRRPSPDDEPGQV